MLTTRRLMLAGIVFALGSAWMAPALAADQSAKQFLERIYKTYVGKNAKGMPIDRPATRRVFTPGLLKLIDADAAAAKGEVGQLDSDPFIDAQDFEIRSFTVEVTETAPGKAKAKVRFKNLDSDDTMSLDLVMTSDRWQIDEIVSRNGSLRALLKQK